MDQQDIEHVLIRTLDFWSSKLKETISLDDIKNLSYRIYEECCDDNIDNCIKYVITESMIDEIKSKGELTTRYDDGTKIKFILENKSLSFMSLENGGLLVWSDNLKEFGFI